MDNGNRLPPEEQEPLFVELTTPARHHGDSPHTHYEPIPELRADDYIELRDPTPEELVDMTDDLTIIIQPIMHKLALGRSKVQFSLTLEGVSGRMRWADMTVAQKKAWNYAKREFKGNTVMAAKAVGEKGAKLVGNAYNEWNELEQEAFVWLRAMVASHLQSVGAPHSVIEAVQAAPDKDMIWQQFDELYTGKQSGTYLGRLDRLARKIAKKRSSAPAA